MTTTHYAIRIGRGQAVHAAHDGSYPICGASANRIGSGVTRVDDAVDAVTCSRCRAKLAKLETVEQ